VSLRFSGALFLAWTVTVGCQRGEEISTYTTPRQGPPRPPIDYAAFARQLDHTLAAILPQGDRAWFFKLAGPAPAIDRRRADFLQFLTTVSPAKSPADPPTWQLPEGWQEKPSTSEFIATVLVMPDEEGPLELSVSSLGLTGDWQDFVTKNVNRWLGQLKQEPLDDATIDKLTQRVATAAGPATLIELAGIMQKSSGANPHAGMAAASPAKKPAGSELVYETPAGWQPGRTTAMRSAAFLIVDGDRQAETTVIALPADAGSQVTDVTANVQRWAGQVGLASLEPAALEKLVEPVTIDGVEGSYVALLGPEDGEHPTGVLAAMVQRDDMVWFFKLTGDRKLAESQQESFRGFLATVKFQ